MPFDGACTPPLPVQAGAGSPGWTGQVSLPRGGLPALQQTAWGGQKRKNWTLKKPRFIYPVTLLLTLAEMILKSVKNRLPAAPLGSCSGIICLIRPGFEFQGFCCELLSDAKILRLSQK